MKILITGTAAGIGHEVARKFLDMGHSVEGIDVLPIYSSLSHEPSYTHHIANIAHPYDLPDIDHVEVLVNCAGVFGTGMDIDVNLKGLMNVTEKYALGNESIKAVINLGAASSHTGTEYPEYIASKGGVTSYTKWVAKEIAKYGATCNCLSFGGVHTEINNPVTEDAELWRQVMELTPLKKWTDPRECADWIYFLATVNKSCSGQDIVIDNLESLNGVFVWE